MTGWVKGERDIERGMILLPAEVAVTVAVEP